MKISKEIKVGILAIVAIGMLIFGYNYLRGENVFESNHHFYAEYEKIDNLFKSNPVLLNGYKIGQVSDVSMDNKTLMLTVEISIPSDIDIPVDSKLKIINSDMIGSKAIQIVYGESTEMAKDGSKFVGERDANIIDEIGNVVTPLSVRLRQILEEVDTAIQDVDLSSTLMAANTAFKSFQETADQLNKILSGKDESLNTIFANIQAVSEDLKALSPRIKAIAMSLDTTTSELAKIDFETTVNQINALSEELTTLGKALNSTDGSLGKLVNEDELYENLNQTIKQLDTLLADMEANPCRYFALTTKQRKKCEDQIEKEKRKQ